MRDTLSAYRPLHPLIVPRYPIRSRRDISPLDTENAIRRLLGAPSVPDPYMELRTDPQSGRTTLHFPDDATMRAREQALRLPPRRARVAHWAGEAHRHLLRAPDRVRALGRAPARRWGMRQVLRSPVLEFHSPHINEPGADPFVEGSLRAPGCTEGLWIDIVALDVADLPDYYRFSHTDRWCFDRDAIGVPVSALTPAIVEEALRRAWRRHAGRTHRGARREPTILTSGVEWEWPAEPGARILREEHVRTLDRAVLGAS